MIMDSTEIGKYIPHRHPFLLVDQVLEIEAYKRIVGIKNVTASEYFFPGHFPGSPVMPGVLMVEALAQLASILSVYSNEEFRGKLIFFAGIDKARFKRKVIPGDQLILTADVLRARGRLIKVATTVAVKAHIFIPHGLSIRHSPHNS